MKYTMNDCDFRDMMNREGSQYKDQFSYEGLGLLFEHLSNDEEDYEFNKVNICLEWTEFKNIEAATREYRVSVDGELEHNTIVLKHDNGIVVVLNF
jgi:hypothetical protein